MNKYINNHNFESNNHDTFENINASILLSVYDKYGKLLHKNLNNTKNNACIVKMNNYRYHVSNCIKSKYEQLNDLIKQFTHKELAEYTLNKVTR